MNKIYFLRHEHLFFIWRKYLCFYFMLSKFLLANKYLVFLLICRFYCLCSDAFKYQTSKKILDVQRNILTLFDMGGGGGHDALQNVFDHCALTLMKRKLKLGDF